MLRLLLALFGWAKCAPPISGTRCSVIVILPASRSTLRQRTPRASPRRRPPAIIKTMAIWYGESVSAVSGSAIFSGATGMAFGGIPIGSGFFSPLRALSFSIGLTAINSSSKADRKQDCSTILTCRRDDRALPSAVHCRNAERIDDADSSRNRMRRLCRVFGRGARRARQRAKRDEALRPNPAERAPLATAGLFPVARVVPCGI